jgi:hypothetical protein
MPLTERSAFRNQHRSGVPEIGDTGKPRLLLAWAGDSVSLSLIRNSQRASRFGQLTQMFPHGNPFVVAVSAVGVGAELAAVSMTVLLDV